jgi:hypothetical protein
MKRKKMYQLHVTNLLRSNGESFDGQSSHSSPLYLTFILLSARLEGSRMEQYDG